jgi:hypothetical protein
MKKYVTKAPKIKIDFFLQNKKLNGIFERKIT